MHSTTTSYKLLFMYLPTKWWRRRPNVSGVSVRVRARVSRLLSAAVRECDL